MSLKLRLKGLATAGAVALVGATWLTVTTMHQASQASEVRGKPQVGTRQSHPVAHPTRLMDVSLSSDQAPGGHIHTRPSIDGAQTPELIRDDVAFRLFFRMLASKDNTAASRIAQRAFVRHVLRAAAALAQDAREFPSVPSEAQINAVLLFIGQYETRLKAPDPQLIEAMRASMPKALGASLATDLDRYVKLQFKRKVKTIF